MVNKSNEIRFTRQKQKLKRNKSSQLFISTTILHRNIKMIVGTLFKIIAIEVIKYVKSKIFFSIRKYIKYRPDVNVLLIAVAINRPKMSYF